MVKKNVFPFIFMLCLSLTPVIAVQTPRFLAFWPLIIGLFMGGWHFYRLKQKLVIPKTYLICGGVLLTLTFLSLTWSIAPEKAFKDAIKIAALLGFGSLWLGICNSIDIRPLKPYLFFLPLGLTVAAFFVIIELSLNMPVYALIHHVPEGTPPNPSEMNRGLVCIVLLFFIGLRLINIGILSRRCKGLLYIMMIGSVLFSILISQSQSAQLAFLVGIITFFIFPYKRQKSYIVLALFVTVCIAFTPFFVDMLFDFFVEQKVVLPWFSNGYAGNRSEIWKFVTLYAMHNPIYGYGLEATRYVEHFDGAQVFHRSQTVLHPHNFAVQVWIEFGIIGVLVFSGLIFKVLTAVKLTHGLAAGTLIATFTAFILVSSVAYSMWQSWWIGFVLFLVGVAILLSRSAVTEKTQAKDL